MREMVSNTEKEQREYYIGGSAPSGDFTAGSTESLREWARSAAENPAPIQYKLSSIDALIKPEYFKKPISGKKYISKRIILCILGRCSLLANEIMLANQRPIHR